MSSGRQRGNMVNIAQPSCQRAVRGLCAALCLVGCLLAIWCYQGLPWGVYKPPGLLGEDEPMDNDDIDRRIFKEKKLVIYSNDFHIGPIQDLKFLLKPLGVRFIDKSLSGHCHLTKTCQRDLKVVNKGNGIELKPKLIPKFYDAYKDDAEMASVDAFVCFHPTSMCELFMPFNKSLIVIASTRYEMGRFGAERWSQWNENLLKISKDPKSVVAGNNLYDAKYIQYFTGIEPQVLASYCGYIRNKYVGDKEGYLLAPVHKPGFQAIFMKAFEKACSEKNCKRNIYPLREKYSHYEYRDLAAHQGIVYVPYQVSVMSLFEQYRMNIPLFFPAKSLLVDWQYEHMVMNERTWAGVGGKQASGSSIPADISHPAVPDPNNDSNKTAINYWLQYADFYRFPHITLYDSYGDLVDKLERTDLKGISEKMRAHNLQLKDSLRAEWRLVLEKVAKFSANHPH